MKTQIWFTGGFVLPEDGKEKITGADEYTMHALIDSDLIDHTTLRVDLEASKDKDRRDEFKKMVLEASETILNKEIDSFYDEQTIK